MSELSVLTRRCQVSDAPQVGREHTAEVQIPRQRHTASRCHRCGAEGVTLQPDNEYEGRWECVESWKSCYQAWRAKCPAWCESRHDRRHERPFEEGVWFHTAPGIDVVVGTEARLFSTLNVGLCTFERVGGGMETPTINIGDDNMTADQARALASALLASANLADMTTADLAIGTAHANFEAEQERKAVDLEFC